MHTSGLRSHDFRIEIAGAPATIDDVFPGFDEHDRLGIVIATDHGAAGAATLILAAVTAFYDRLRAGGEPFFAYADYFAFHVGGRRGELRKLDVWPDHKEVVLPAGADAEDVLRAVNDRGVTRLLVPEGDPAGADLAPETVASAQRRIVTGIAYAPGGRVAEGDVAVAADAAATGFIRQMLETTGAPAAAGPPAAAQTFRRLDVAAALDRLTRLPGKMAEHHFRTPCAG